MIGTDVLRTCHGSSGLFRMRIASGGDPCVHGHPSSTHRPRCVSFVSTSTLAATCCASPPNLRHRSTTVLEPATTRPETSIDFAAARFHPTVGPSDPLRATSGEDDVAVDVWGATNRRTDDGRRLRSEPVGCLLEDRKTPLDKWKRGRLFGPLLRRLRFGSCRRNKRYRCVRLGIRPSQTPADPSSGGDVENAMDSPSNLGPKNGAWWSYVPPPPSDVSFRVETKWTRCPRHHATVATSLSGWEHAKLDADTKACHAYVNPLRTYTGGGSSSAPTMRTHRSDLKRGVGC